jgi:hypothetical protein
MSYTTGHNSFTNQYLLNIYTCSRLQIIYRNKNVNVRLFKVLNLRKFFTDFFEILIQRCIRIRACFYIPVLYRCDVECLYMKIIF